MSMNTQYLRKILGSIKFKNIESTEGETPYTCKGNNQKKSIKVSFDIWNNCIVIDFKQAKNTRVTKRVRRKKIEQCNEK